MSKYDVYVSLYHKKSKIEMNGESEDEVRESFYDLFGKKHLIITQVFPEIVEDVIEERCYEI